jgi:regulator of sirC expression with transglutaminase-like and TPR domain
MHESTVETAKALRESEKAALLTLLGDEDDAVYAAVRARLLSLGGSAREWLRPHQFSRNRLVAGRVSEILRQLDRDEADQRFSRFCLSHGEDFDLETAAWLLAQTAYPDINVEGYTAMLDEFAGELRSRIALYRRGNQILGRINDFLFREQGFAGNLDGEDEPDHFYLNRVVDRRAGNATSLSLLYAVIARRLGLPVAGVDLAGHFLCRYQTAAEEIYIDAFHHGRLLSRADCVHYLIRNRCDVKDNYLSPVRPRYWLYRLCEQLSELYRRRGETPEFERVSRYLAMIHVRVLT